MKALNKLIGNKILKNIRNKFEKKLINSRQAQNELFLKVKKSIKGTSIYQGLNLDTINSYEDYVKKVPVVDYDFYKPYIDRVLAGETKALFNDSLDYIGVTSGTSGYNDKRIPYTKKMLKKFESYQKKFASTMNYVSPQSNPLFSERFSYGTQIPVDQTKKIPEGYISGILNLQTPKFMEKYIFPSKETLSMTNWDEKVARIIEEVKDRDIRIISGIPSYIINLSEQILNALKIKNLSEIWPNLELFVYGGTHIDNYKDRLNQLAGRELKYLGTYIATEAPIGFMFKAHENFVFNVDSILYSFTHINDMDGETLAIDELKVGESYLVNIGTPNGLLQYAMKDVVRVTSIYPYVQFEIVGRKDTAINIAAEKVPHDMINKVVDKTSKDLNLTINHYFLYPSENKANTPCYEWGIILGDNVRIDEDALAKALDENLIDLCEDYLDCRRKCGTIGDPIVRIIPRKLERDYFIKFKDKGQLKMKNIFENKANFITLVEKISPQYACELMAC